MRSLGNRCALFGSVAGAALLAGGVLCQTATFALPRSSPGRAARGAIFQAVSAAETTALGASEGARPAAAARSELVTSLLGRGGFSLAGAAGTACVSATWCVAVGSGTVLHGQTRLTSNTALIWRFGGRSWRLADRLRVRQGALLSVSCVSSSFCMAVGRTGNPLGRVLAVEWNGRAWSLVRAADPASSGNGDALGSVDCLSRSDCWAVGGVNLGEGSPHLRHDLVEHWNGRAFTAVAAPVTGNSLIAIACPGPANCWASGYPSGSQRSTNEIEHFDGRAWRTVRVQASFAGGASGISCRTFATCWLVGATTGGGLRPTSLRLLEGTWRNVAMVSPSYPDVTLQGLSCASASDCWAVGGNYLVGPGITRPSKTAPFGEQWDGSSWQIAEVLGPAASRSGFFATAACAPTGLCIAAGQASDGQPLFAVSRSLG